MTFAWYGHLKLQDVKIITPATPLIIVILISWGIALLEYCCQVPANRIGFSGNGGPFSLMAIKGDARSHHPYCIHIVYGCILQRRAVALEPSCCVRVLDSRSLFRVYEVGRLS